MKYIGYILLLLSGLAGYLGVRIWFVVLLALLSAFLFMSARQQNLKETPQAPDQSMLMDGAYLFLAGGRFVCRFSVWSATWDRRIASNANRPTPSHIRPKHQACAAVKA